MCLSGPAAAARGMNRRIIPAHYVAYRSLHHMQYSLTQSIIPTGIPVCFPYRGQQALLRCFSSQPRETTVDKVSTLQQQVYCEVGCNDDERGRGQELSISVTVWENSLRNRLLKLQPDFADVEAQRARAESHDWKSHALTQLQGTHNNESLSQIVGFVAEEGRWFTIEALADCIARQVLEECNAPKVTVLIEKPDALRKRGVRTAACELTRTWAEIFAPEERGSAAKPLTDKVMTIDQQVHCEIGCTADERDRLQEVLVSITVWDWLRDNVMRHQPDFDDLAAQKVKAASLEWRTHSELQLRGTHNNATLAKIAQRVAEQGKWFTIEALADSIAQEVLLDGGAPRVTVRVEKPQALRRVRVRAAACEVTRDAAAISEGQ